MPKVTRVGVGTQHQNPSYLTLQASGRKEQVLVKAWEEVWYGWSEHEKRRVERDSALETGRDLIMKGLAALLKSLAGF